MRTSVVTPQPEDRPAEPAKARLLVSRSASAVTARRIRKHPWRRTDPRIRRGFGCVDTPACSHRRTGPVEAPIPGCSTYLPRLLQLAERIDDEAGCHAMTVTPSARRPPQVTEAGNGVGAPLRRDRAARRARDTLEHRLNAPGCNSIVFSRHVAENRKRRREPARGPPPSVRDETAQPVAQAAASRMTI